MSEARQPTAQGVSALLKRASYVRGIPKMRGGQSGYRVRQGKAGEVLVNRYSFMGASREQEQRHLDGYAKTIRDAGYSVTLDDRMRWLVVTANDEPPAPIARGTGRPDEENAR